MTDVYELRDLKETIEEALEDLWNSRDERFRDKMIFSIENRKNHTQLQ